MITITSRDEYLMLKDALIKAPLKQTDIRWLKDTIDDGTFLSAEWLIEDLDRLIRREA